MRWNHLSRYVPLLVTITATLLPTLVWAGGGGGAPGGGGEGGGAPEPGVWAMMIAGAVPGTWAVRSALRRRATPTPDQP